VWSNLSICRTKEIKKHHTLGDAHKPEDHHGHLKLGRWASRCYGSYSIESWRRHPQTAYVLRSGRRLRRPVPQVAAEPCEQDGPALQACVHQKLGSSLYSKQSDATDTHQTISQTYSLMLTRHFWRLAGPIWKSHNTLQSIRAGVKPCLAPLCVSLAWSDAHPHRQQSQCRHRGIPFAAEGEEAHSHGPDLLPRSSAPPSARTQQRGVERQDDVGSRVRCRDVRPTWRVHGEGARLHVAVSAGSCCEATSGVVSLSKHLHIKYIDQDLAGRAGLPCHGPHYYEVTRSVMASPRMRNPGCVLLGETPTRAPRHYFQQ
jgi:hypothetical protein